MSQLIWRYRARLRRREARRDRARGRREADQARLSRRGGGRRRRCREFQRRRLPRGGRRDRRRRRALWANADIVFKVRAPSAAEVGLMRERAKSLVSFIWPAQNPELMQQLAAQQGDRARDGQRAAHLARAEDGRAVVDGQHRRLPRGDRGGATPSAASSPARSPRPARCRRPRCSSIGAGVAGLAAIGTAVGLGAIVRAFDTRAEVADQVEVAGRRVRRRSTTRRKAPAAAATPR